MKSLSSLALISVGAFFLSLTLLLWIYAPPILRHADGVLTRAEGVEGKLNASAVNLDKATKSWSDSAKGQLSAIQDLTTQAQGTLSQAGDAAQRLSISTSKTADAATALLASAKLSTDALPPLIGDIDADTKSAKDAIEDTELTLSTYSNAGDDLDQLLKREAVGQILDHAAGVLAHADAISADGQKVSDKLTNDFVAPKPWWRKIGPSIGDVWDFGALAARHMP